MNKEQIGMNKGQGRNSMKLMSILGLCLLIVCLGFFTGCGSKPPVETDTTGRGSEEPVETVQEPVVTEEPVTQPERDYSIIVPQEYGVEDVFFGFDQYDLSDEAMDILAANARILRDIPQAVLMIAGHCDERGTIEYNLALGEKRALAVKDYLTSLGVPSSRLRVTSYGESKPFVTGSNEDAWALNRRAHFQLP